MSLVSFRYRSSKPTHPTPGYFYWVDFQDGTHQIWFAPDEQASHLILLNKDVDLTPYVTADVLAEYAKLTDIPDVHELTDSDYDIIAEKVNEKTLNLTWKEI